MSMEAIISDWKKGKFKPLYWLEGDEPYFIDNIVNYAESKILSEADASFNLSIFYGKDADWVNIVNACKRYPMFSERQVVILKEAQQMNFKDLEKLQPYIENPLSSTIFVVSHKDKKIDGRSKIAKAIKQNGELFSTKKMYDDKLPDFAASIVNKHQLTITQKALFLLVDHIGNDLSRIENEIEKLAINLNGRKQITEDDIENYIGISKEFNVFELQAALAQRNFAKAIRIIHYFEANPKASPIQMTLPALYNYFSKVYMVFSVGSSDNTTIAQTLEVNPYFVKDYMAAAKQYGQQSVEKVLLLLQHYNLKSVGINTSYTAEGELMKELVTKMMYC